MDRMVNNNQLIWKLVWMLRTYKTCNSTVRFSKCKFYKKLLGGIILLKVTLGVTWIQLYICVCVCVCVSYYGSLTSFSKKKENKKKK